MFEPKLLKKSNQFKINISLKNNFSSFVGLFDKFKYLFVYVIVIISIYFFSEYTSEFIINIFRLKKIILISNQNTGIKGNFYDYNLLTLNLKSLEKNIVNQNSSIEAIEVKRKWPDTIIIELKNSIPIAYFITQNQKFNLYDNSSLEEYKQFGEKIPSIISSEKNIYPVSSKLSNNWINVAINLIKANIQDIEILTISYNEDKFLEVKTNLNVIYLPVMESNLDINSTLQTLLHSFRIKGSMPSMIDLRFDKPIIKF